MLEAIPAGMTSFEWMYDRADWASGVPPLPPGANLPVLFDEEWPKLTDLLPPPKPALDTADPA